MSRLPRRKFLLLAATAPLLLASPASAALKMPTRVPPPRVRPLGQFKLLDARPKVEKGTTSIVDLVFRSDIDVLQPELNWWPRAVPVPPLPPPVWLPLPQRLTPTPTPGPDPYRRPLPEDFGEEILGGLWTPVELEIDARNSSCGNYRITVEMNDPQESRRKALFSFQITVADSPCPRPTRTP